MEKNEKEGGRVGYFLDCGLLVFYSFLSLFFLPPGAGFLIAFLSCVSVICCGYAVRKKALQLILCILFGFLGLAVPEIFIFYPCLFYLLFHEKVKDTQITREIDYCLENYKKLAPAVMLSYEREAFYAKDNHEFRITFDQNILWRNYDLSLCKGIYGEAILAKNKVLMEVKTAGAIPL